MLNTIQPNRLMPIQYKIDLRGTCRRKAKLQTIIDVENIRNRNCKEFIENSTTVEEPKKPKDAKTSEVIK